MNADEFAVLERAQRILARMPKEHSSTKEAHALFRAVETDSASAKRILFDAGLVDIANALLNAGQTLRATGHFAGAECMDALTAVLRSWDRRVAPRAPRRTSG